MPPTPQRLVDAQTEQGIAGPAGVPWVLRPQARRLPDSAPSMADGNQTLSVVGRDAQAVARYRLDCGSAGLRHGAR